MKTEFQSYESRIKSSVTKEARPWRSCSLVRPSHYSDDRHTHIQALNTRQLAPEVRTSRYFL